MRAHYGVSCVRVGGGSEIKERQPNAQERAGKVVGHAVVAGRCGVVVVAAASCAGCRLRLKNWRAIGVVEHH